MHSDLLAGSFNKGLSRLDGFQYSDATWINGIAAGLEA
jgi:hypothetical protein